MQHGKCGRVALGTAFVTMGLGYWFDVFPVVRRELDGWHRHAARIPDPTLRRDAVESLASKRGNVEGAAAFAAMAPRKGRSGLVRLLVAFQAMHDYLDTLSEQPAEDILANGRQLHRALTLALEPTAEHADYYARHALHDDGGYLRAFVRACQQEVAVLASFAEVASAARRAAALSGEAQSRLHAESDGGFEERARWGAAQVRQATWLDGWEIAAAACSTLTIYALLTAASGPIPPGEIDAIEDAYFPWITGLSTLLDSLADVEDDAATGADSHVSVYGDASVVAQRLGRLVRECLARAGSLAHGEKHAVLLTGMIGYYLHPTKDSDSPLTAVRRELLANVGRLRWVTRAIFRVRSLIRDRKARF